MKTYAAMEVWLHHSEPRHQMEVSGQLHTPALPPEQVPPGTQWIIWVGPTTLKHAVRKRNIYCACVELNPDSAYRMVQR
jgi:hypothetical protein